MIRNVRSQMKYYVLHYNSRSQMKYEHFPKESIPFCTLSRKNRHPLRKQKFITEAYKRGRRPKAAAAPFLGAAAEGRRFYIVFLRLSAKKRCSPLESVHI